MNKEITLPSPAEIALLEIGSCLKDGRSVGRYLERAIFHVSALPIEHLGSLWHRIADTAKLQTYPESLRTRIFFRRRLSHRQQLDEFPELSYLFLFHRDGRLREAALKIVAGGLPSPFLFGAVLMRLNDWADPVRSAALECTRRCFPLTSPEIVVQAAMILLPRLDSWGRWSDEREAIDLVLRRADVARLLADSLASEKSGPASRTLKAVLKHDAIDAHLERLAMHAAQPSVRAMAVTVIADKQACWPVGAEWKWVDKSMGERIRVPKIRCREISGTHERSNVIEVAASDRSAMVRKAALDALIRGDLGKPIATDIAARLVADRNRSVRERAAYILSRHTEHSSDIPTREEPGRSLPSQAKSPLNAGNAAFR